MKTFSPWHINAKAEDFTGNGSAGRYILLPGSDGRAQAISRHFENLVIQTHPRGHHLYLGTIAHQGKTIEVAAISSGMGCPSMEIILHELFQLGARRFLRVGTAGSLQPATVKIGDIVNVQASVRDERTTEDYAPLGVPAIASLEVVTAMMEAASALSFTNIHTGMVHCKSSLYAREMAFGPLSASNQAYADTLTRYGVLASEMETAALFIQSQYYDHLSRQANQGRVLCGAVLGVISLSHEQVATVDETNQINTRLIELALQTLMVMHAKE